MTGGALLAGLATLLVGITRGVGARVLLAERDRIGGDCTWTGCAP
jgi:hypothetical protein